MLAIHSCMLVTDPLYILIAEDTCLHEGLFDSYSNGVFPQDRTNQLYIWEYVGSKPQIHAYNYSGFCSHSLAECSNLVCIYMHVFSLVQAPYCSRLLILVCLYMKTLTGGKIHHYNDIPYMKMHVKP